MIDQGNTDLFEEIKTVVGVQPVASATYDVCIVGAGVAGASLAAYLGQQRIRVALIERDLSEPNRVIGELLQPGGVLELEAMGLENVLDGIDAQPVYGYALFNKGVNFNIPYPRKGGKSVQGRGFRYGKFIQSIRRAARQHPSVTLIEGKVKDLEQDARNNVINGVRYVPRGSTRDEALKASLTVVCDGCVSSLRKKRKLCNSKKTISGYFLGLLLEDCVLPYPNHGHVFVGDPSPFLSYPISSTQTRVLIDFPGRIPKLNSDNFKDYLIKKIGTQLPKAMLSAFNVAVRKGNFQAMPNRVMPANPAVVPGVVLLGDSLNMRHPLTGGGMTVALTDVRTLGSLLLNINDFTNEAKVSAAVKSYYSNRHEQNATINILASALYGVFSHPELSGACFEYLNRGGDCAAGPIALLSGVSRDLRLLIRHFFAVARFGVSQTLKPIPTPRNLSRAYRMVQEALHIIHPLLMAEKPTQRTRLALSLAKIVFP